MGKIYTSILCQFDSAISGNNGTGETWLTNNLGEVHFWRNLVLMICNFNTPIKLLVFKEKSNIIIIHITIEWKCTVIPIAVHGWGKLNTVSYSQKPYPWIAFQYTNNEFDVFQILPYFVIISIYKACNTTYNFFLFYLSFLFFLAILFGFWVFY